MTYARLSAVYGLSYTDINAMPLSAINAYIERIPAVLAERRLVVADGASVPWMQDPERVLRSWFDMAYGEVAAKPATPGELMLLGIAVKRVKPDGN